MDIYRVNNNYMDFEREISHFQEKFCLTADLFVQCFDTEGNPITKMSGEAEDVAALKGLISESEIKALLERVSEGTLEDVAVEDFKSHGVRLAALSVSNGTYKQFAWFVAGVIDDDVNRFRTHTTDKRFFDALETSGKKRGYHGGGGTS